MPFDREFCNTCDTPTYGDEKHKSFLVVDGAENEMISVCWECFSNDTTECPGCGDIVYNGCGLCLPCEYERMEENDGV